MREKRDGDTDEFNVAPTPESQRFWSVSPVVQVDLGALSDRGKVRPNNEDHFLVARFDRNMQMILTNLPAGHVPKHSTETAYGMLVADGMGGESAGEVASRYAISYLMYLVLQTPDWILRLDDQLLPVVRQRMEMRLQQVQEALTGQAREDPALWGMGTTLTLACSAGADLLLFHAGDSRAYLFRQNQLHRLTCDHTVAQTLADVGAIRPQDVASHPLRHVLTNVVGGKDELLRVEHRELRLEDGDQILLCTDGLSDLVSDDAIVEALRKASAASDACSTLVNLALDSGGNDNVTVVLGRYRISES